MIARGTLIVRNMALCGGCHTAAAAGSLELGGNPLFPVPTPNLTNDSTGIGNWSDEQVMNAFRNGIDDAGRHLSSAMPYWLFHNMSDGDALSVVAFLRSLPVSSVAVGEANPDATAVTPLSPTAFPDSSLQANDAGYAEAQMGKYLVSGVAQCVKCHSPTTAGLPSGSFLSGAVPVAGKNFGSNLTPDATGLDGWTADDVATALKAGTNKAGATLCGSMPAAAKGYGGMTDADAHAIGVYLTTIPAVANAVSAPALEPVCP
jgi:mono/diheme cytochrome c family protein